MLIPLLEARRSVMNEHRVGVITFKKELVTSY